MDSFGIKKTDHPHGLPETKYNLQSLINKYNYIIANYTDLSRHNQKNKPSLSYNVIKLRT